MGFCNLDILPLYNIDNQKLIVMTEEQRAIAEKVNRCLQIEQEYDSIIDIRLTSENIEDVDDIYQEKLEQQWYKQELEDEYKQLNMELGYTKRELADKSSRRTGM